MHRILIDQVMTRAVITIHPEALVADATQLMYDHGLRRLPVIDADGCLVGIVTDADLNEAETAESAHNPYEPGADERWLTVADVMSRTVITITPDATVGQLAELLIQHKIGGVPVVAVDPVFHNRQWLIGIVTETDIFRIIAEAWRRGEG